MKINRDISLRHFLLLIGILLLVQSCKNDSVTEPNNTSSKDTIATSISMHDRYLDLDGDGKNDFLFTHSAVTTTSYPPPPTSYSLYVVGFDSNQVQNTYSIGSIPLQDSVQISDTSGWNNYSMSLAGATSASISHWTGSWTRDNKRNLGLRLKHSGLYYYGWVKLSVDSTNGYLTIIDSAYCAIANTPILAGIHP